MTEVNAVMGGWIACKLCAVSAPSCFDKLSMRESLNLVLSRAYAPCCAPKGEVGTPSRADSVVLHSATCCDAG